MIPTVIKLIKKLIAKRINNGFVKSKYDSTNDSTDDMENSLSSRDCKDENILRLKVKLYTCPQAISLGLHKQSLPKPGFVNVAIPL